MRRLNLDVVSQSIIADSIYELTVEGSGVENMRVPGQFLHVKTGEGHSSLLRRPISICDVDILNQRLTMVYRAQGKGTVWLSARKPGEKVDLLGPLGNGFTAAQPAGGEALLVGGGIGVPPLYYLGRKLRENGVRVSFALGFQSKKDSFYIEKFHELGQTDVATADGTLGMKGFVTDLISDRKAKVKPVVFACGPSQMLGALKDKTKGLKAYFSFEERMGCGVGACFACVCKADNKSGYVKICSDGPVFAKEEVLL
ncbi:dihydroorotate dehydrogenase electron transfer subunit [Fictibacillus iocasae]|uniref:Dihydroorotate dehydrogenase B (NAD(+)), electron transfer subunit n=1 Tax=Fictibacillus iocasae TaxID=2715437 RepID=A0ABW2NTY8_9BACL